VTDAYGRPIRIIIDRSNSLSPSRKSRYVTVMWDLKVLDTLEHAVSIRDYLSFPRVRSRDHGPFLLILLRRTSWTLVNMAT
jgi:hypothetical protein